MGSTARGTREASGPALGKAALALGSALLVSAAVGAGELLIRGLRPEALRATRVYREHIYSELYGWTPRPNAKGEWTNGKSYSINRAGYRGRALAGSSPRARRVLVLGDSIAFGSGVDDRETFAQRLQTTGSGLAVANLGVSGFGTDQELLLLEHAGFALEPDVVLLSVCLSNDYADNMLDSYLHDLATPKPYFVLEGERLELRDAHLKKRWIERAGLRLEERSHLWSALRLLAMRSPSGRPTPTTPVAEHWVSRQSRVLDDFASAAELTRRLIARIAALCRARGVDFTVLLHPDRASYQGDAQRVSPIESPPLEASGIRVIDLRRHYWAAGLGYDLVAFDDIGHLTPTGHAFVAEVLREELR